MNSIGQEYMPFSPTEAAVVVRSKAVVMSLLIHYLLLFPLCVGMLCFILVFMWCLVSFLVLKSSSWGRESWLIYLHCLKLLSCGRKRSVSLSYGAMGWSEVCNCGISLSYSLTFYFVSCLCPSSIIVSLNDVSS